ncbi:flagellin [Alkalicoccus urumqiensis]|uniref:Flagellin n=1 Tax=Alkalicoccus urumqiensis TaxID=1548213 RepID=A0A2P6MH92_ALKUR|nr:flagellin [Alkalicoccus urumqiensis]PRO65656.1 flagellin [Alkalicoccus urumqiensis]
MIINNNIPALNTHRQMGINQNAMQNSMEKLSSGLRINRAGDDAAGLAISEKMRAQINGLDQASRNAQDGISLIQTAEGALDETHSILQRMRELSVQSANDTNVEVDREELQKEVDQLSAEITRIAETTEFNTQNLLTGDFEGKFHIGANGNQNIKLSIADMSADALGVAGADGATFTQEVTITQDTSASLTDGTYTVGDVSNYSGAPLDSANIENDAADVTHVMYDSDGNVAATSEDGGESWYAYAATEQDSFSFDGKVKPGDEIEISSSGTVATAKVSVETELASGTYTVSDISDNATYGGDWELGLTDSNGNIVALGATALTGAGASTADPTAVTNWVDVNDTSSSLLTVSANDALSLNDEIVISGEGIDISSQASADKAITTINDAIERVSAERSMLGANQNRLEHTISNLDNSSENLSAAESRIRDVDMAKEMMEMTRANILSQASQSMLAQANQQPQSVLQLLG